MVKTEEDDLQFLEDALSEIEENKIRQNLEMLEQDNLCQVLGVTPEQIDGLNKDSRYAYILYEYRLLPESIREKIKEHLDKCYLCNLVYQDYLTQEREITEGMKDFPHLISDKEISLSLNKVWNRLKSKS